jgi:hypothetical protein
MLPIASPPFHSHGFLVLCRGRKGMSAVSMIFRANAVAGLESVYSNSGGDEVDRGAIK